MLVEPLSLVLERGNMYKIWAGLSRGSTRILQRTNSTVPWSLRRAVPSGARQSGVSASTCIPPHSPPWDWAQHCTWHVVYITQELCRSNRPCDHPASLLLLLFLTYFTMGAGGQAIGRGYFSAALAETPRKAFNRHLLYCVINFGLMVSPH